MSGFIVYMYFVESKTCIWMYLRATTDVYSQQQIYLGAFGLPGAKIVNITSAVQYSAVLKWLYPFLACCVMNVEGAYVYFYVWLSAFVCGTVNWQVIAVE